MHIDVMRDPFIMNKNTFSEESLALLSKEFLGSVKLDFHLMDSNPDKTIEIINKIIPLDKRNNTLITIHREAFRSDLGEYNRKEYDLLNITLEKLDLLEVNTKTGEMVYQELNKIKEEGYLVGLALEPGTSLQNISPEMMEIVDSVLLMSVSSGAGNQKFILGVISKIQELRKNHQELSIQVDGGINEEIIPEVLKAGADNFVIGSYITSAVDPIGQVKKLKELIK